MRKRKRVTTQVVVLFLVRSECQRGLSSDARVAAKGGTERPSSWRISGAPDRWQVSTASTIPRVFCRAPVSDREQRQMREREHRPVAWAASAGAAR
jgi:hypothetical protein